MERQARAPRCGEHRAVNRPVRIVLSALAAVVLAAMLFVGYGFWQFLAHPADVFCHGPNNEECTYPGR